MTNETLRMQMLAGIITEGEYKAKLQESLWDRIKDTPKAWIARIKGGTPAIIASAFSDGGIKIGVPVYFYDGGSSLNKMTIKSIDYNTGISDIIYEKSLDNGKTWKTDEKESLETKLGFDEDLSKLSTKTPEEQKTWYDKTVESIKDSFSTKDVSYRIEDLKPDTPKEKPEWKSNKYIDTPSISLEKQREYSQFAKVAENKKKKSLKESMIGGIVGIGAINQIPPRAKADYEMAFEHFLGERYETKFENREQDPYTMKEEEVEETSLYENVDEEVKRKIMQMVDDAKFEDSQKGNDLRFAVTKALFTPDGQEIFKNQMKHKLKKENNAFDYYGTDKEALNAFFNDGMNKNKKIDDQTYRDQMAAIQGGYY
jgi:hypothetical protein